MASFPRGVSKPLFESVEGQYAVVLLETGTSSHSYPYEVLCHSPGSSWQEISSSNGPGWHELPDGRAVVSFWGPIEGRSEPVLVSLGGTIYEASASAGYFFIAIWDPANPEDPHVPAMPQLVET